MTRSATPGRRRAAPRASARAAPAARQIAISACTDADLTRAAVVRLWGDDCLVIAGRAHAAREMDVLVARDAAVAGGEAGPVLGFGFYTVKGTTLLIGSIMVHEQRIGIGSALFAAVCDLGRARQLQTVRACTTNDNIAGLLFYQRLGMRLSALYPGAADAFRALKPGLWVQGQHGLVVRDLIELEMRL